MQDMAENANRGEDEKEESADSNTSPLYSGTMLSKRLRSKVWDDFIPFFVDGRVARAECKHCHRVYNCSSTNGTGSLLRHQASCSSGTLKRPRQQEHTSLPDPMQKKLSFFPSSQKKHLGTTDASPEQGLTSPGAHTNDTNTKNQEVDQNGSHDKLEGLTLPGPHTNDTSTKNQEVDQNGSHDKLEGLTLPGPHTNDTSTKNQEVDQNGSHDKLEGLTLPGPHTNDTNTKNQEVDQNGSHDKLEGLTLPGPHTNDTNTKNQEVDQNGSHDKLVVPEQKNLASLKQVVPTGTNCKNQEVKQNFSHEEIVRVLSIHGHNPSMMEQDRIKKLVAYLNPMVKMPSLYLNIHFLELCRQEESKLKEKLIALRSLVCLSAYVWRYDPRPHLAFLCLTVHYIDDKWEKQQKIIRFHAVNPSCNAKELGDIIWASIINWNLCGKIFSIILDDAFIDDTVALDVKARLQGQTKLAANRSFFVVRYATHVLGQVIQVGLDELDTYMGKTAKFSKYTTGSIPSVVQYSNCNYAPSTNDWKHAKKICKILQDFHNHMDSMQNFPSPTNFFDKLWDVKKVVHRKDFMYRSRKEEAFSKVRENMKRKFMETWRVCCLHFFMPMAMDPKDRLRHVMSRLRLDRDTFDDDMDDYLQEVLDTLASLFNEYSNLVEDHNSTSEAKTRKETVVSGLMLMRYFCHIENPYGERTLSELYQYLEEPCLTTGDSSVLEWWKEHDLTYPTIARMSRDILALPCSIDCKVASRTAIIAITESQSNYWVEELVYVQDWLKPAGFGDDRSCDTFGGI